MRFPGNHLTRLETSASIYASHPAFRIPRLDPRTGQVQEWDAITYAELKKDVELFAKYWAKALKAKDIREGSTVGIWIGGMLYIDLLHIYGVSRAGYVPQMFSLRLSSPEVVFELLKKAEAKALIYDLSYEPLLNNSPLPTFLAVNAKDAGFLEEDLPDVSTVSGNDTAFVFHTSGSTSGSPKLVPWTHAWCNFYLDKDTDVNPAQRSVRIMMWSASLCHAAQSLTFLKSLSHGDCTVQATKIPYSSEELMDAVERCGVNHLAQFPTFLSKHLQQSRQDARLLSILRGLDEIIYGGLPLAREDEEWACQKGIKLLNVFGSTECGLLLTSIGGRGSSTGLLRPVSTGSYEFRPVVPDTDSEAEHRSTTKLLELIVLSDSGDCPHHSLRHADGHFHTGDLFEEVTPGIYASRGRDDDWIKSENSLRCDTKALEDNVRATCGHLVEECVVVGYGRPSPALFVEALVAMDHDKLRREIVRLIRPFNSRRYVHERITSEEMVVVVPSKTLPRTAAKGNIRRRAVEDAYKSQLDEIYSSPK